MEPVEVRVFNTVTTVAAHIVESIRVTPSVPFGARGTSSKRGGRVESGKGKPPPNGPKRTPTFPTGNDAKVRTRRVYNRPLSSRAATCAAAFVDLARDWSPTTSWPSILRRKSLFLTVFLRRKRRIGFESSVLNPRWNCATSSGIILTGFNIDSDDIQWNEIRVCI